MAMFNNQMVYIYIIGCKDQTLATGVPNTGYVHMCGTSSERFLGPGSSPEKLSALGDGFPWKFKS